jgi:mevalonate kinase
MIQQERTYRANGKLLLSGEYFVLDGALALALPTRLGQTLSCQPGPGQGIEWKSYDADGHLWFQGIFSLPGWALLEASDVAIGQSLEKIGQAVYRLRPEGWAAAPGLKIVTQLEFPRHWGLGSSSTLIALFAALTGADPYALLAASFGGSAYDLACATANGPILFQRNAGIPHFVQIPYRPAFRKQLFFVYLGKKQDSREGIARYRAQYGKENPLTQRIGRLTWEIAAAADFDQFCTLLDVHESRISEALQLPKVRELYFADFPGSMKSLGAWGGDFILAASPLPAPETIAYFREKGFDICLEYDDLILNHF